MSHLVYERSSLRHTMYLMFQCIPSSKVWLKTGTQDRFTDMYNLRQNCTPGLYCTFDNFTLIFSALT